MLNFLQKRWKVLLGGAAGGLFLAFLAFSLLIGHQVREAVAAAQDLEQGEPVAALMAVARSPEYTLKQRNNAIWALGQLGDARALPILENLHDGQECRHQDALCQHELRKAIDGCRGGVNIGAVVWRHGDLASR